MKIKFRNTKFLNGSKIKKLLLIQLRQEDFFGYFNQIEISAQKFFNEIESLII